MIKQHYYEIYKYFDNFICSFINGYILQSINFNQPAKLVPYSTYIILLSVIES